MGSRREGSRRLGPHVVPFGGQSVYLYRCESVEGTRYQNAFDQMAQVLVLVVEDIGIEPCRALLYESGPQRDLFGSNLFEQVVNRRECVADTGRDEGVVAVKDAQVRGGHFDQSPRKVGFLYVLHCDHRDSASFWRQVGAESIAYENYGHQFPRADHP